MSKTNMTYHVLRSLDGGPNERELLAALKAAGFKVAKVHSELVGHYGLRVFGNQREQKKVETIIRGK